MPTSRRKKQGKGKGNGQPLSRADKKVIASHILATEAAIKILAVHVKKLRRATKTATVHHFL